MPLEIARQLLKAQKVPQSKNLPQTTSLSPLIVDQMKWTRQKIDVPWDKGQVLASDSYSTDQPKPFFFQNKYGRSNHIFSFRGGTGN